ncbi:MAG: response regulator [Candidatus Omnitrophica bacterium]|nr:response regulator [Candidatus Omnitrophota bacterium]
MISRESPKILIVDDDTNLCTLLATRLNHSGYTTYVAHTGTDALKTARRESPDLCILDILLPGMPGYDLLKRLKAEPGLKKKPHFILISGRADMTVFFDKADVEEFLTKPFDPAELLSKIERVLARGKAPAASREPERSSPSKAPGGKRVLVAGNQEFILNKLKEHLQSLRYQVLTDWEEKAALETARAEKPDWVLCQLWEDRDIFDAFKVYETLKQTPETKSCRFVLLCPQALAVEAAQNFKAVPVIIYMESSDLKEKVAQILASKYQTTL